MISGIDISEATKKYRDVHIGYGLVSITEAAHDRCNKSAHIDVSGQGLDINDGLLEVWRAVYRSFGINPKRMKPSVVALHDRFRRDGCLPKISPVVDMYNALSLQYGVPMSALDANRIDGNLSLRPYAPASGLFFTPLSEPTKTITPKEGEFVYQDQSRVVTRAWNHRDCDATRVDESSNLILFLIESVMTTDGKDRVYGTLSGLIASVASIGAVVSQGVLEDERSMVQLP